MPGVRNLVVMLPSGDWAVMPSGAKLEVAVVDQDAIEELKRGVDIRDVTCRARYGLFLTDMTDSLYTCATKEK